MSTTPSEENVPPKQEGNRKTVDHGEISKAAIASSSSTTPWSRLKDPRIVRVSRAFGGKDRHSKVCTVRGLRDRRVRLSVPTAIQLYDLQDRLGLNQPSKAVDWLLNAAKHEIDELPPLQIPPQNLGQNHGNVDNWDDPLGQSRSNFWSLDATLRDKDKEITTEMADEKENWNQENGEEKQDVSPNNFFPRPNNDHSFMIPGLLNNVMSYNSFYRLDTSNFPSTHVGSHGFSSPQTEDFLNFNFVPLPSTLSLSSAQPYFPSSHVANSVDQLDPKQISHFQMLSSNSQNSLLNVSLTPTLYSTGQSMRPLPSQDSGGSQSNDKVEFPPK